MHRLIRLSNALDGLIEFEKPEKKYRPITGTVGTLGALVGLAKAQAYTVKPLTGPIKSLPRPEDRPALRHIKGVAKQAGYGVHEIRGRTPGGAWTTEGLPKEIQKAGLKQVKALTGSRAKKGIAISGNVRPALKPGVLAHEVGHALQPKWMSSLPALAVRSISPRVALAGSLYAAQDTSEKRSKAAAIGTSLAMAPVLAHEVGASVRGARILKKAGIKGIRRLSPGIGLASYGSIAAFPWAAYGIKKSLGGYKPKEKKLSALLDGLIEFKLFQPKRGEEPPETLPRLTAGTLADYNVQRHEAKRAGLHRDVRIGTKRSGLVSWATRKDLPGEGGKIGVHPQPVHPHSYLGWEGDIPSGYGAGKVSTEKLGKALITKSGPGEVHATLADQKEHHRLAFLRTAKGWLLTRGKHPEPPREAKKPEYKSVSPDKAHEHLSSIEPGTIVQPKVDGALVYVSTKGNRPEIFSHRKGKQSGRNILHTERFFHGRPTTAIPKEHQRTLIGELYGTRGGKAIEPQELGGILNTHLGKSIQKQKQKNVKLKIMPFDYADGKGEPYPERLEKVRQTVAHLPQDAFHTPEGATGSSASRLLFQKIRAGRHPLTKEGVIIHPPHGKMIKIKNTEEANVKITGTFPGTGKFKGSHGGITYEGGRVGTGFTDETRHMLHKHIGRIARIRHQGRYPSGAYRAPSFIAVEENK